MGNEDDRESNTNERKKKDDDSDDDSSGPKNPGSGIPPEPPSEPMVDTKEDSPKKKEIYSDYNYQYSYQSYFN